MANQSAKRNEQSIRSTIMIMNGLIYGLIVWFLGSHAFFIISESVSIWKFLICLLISAVSYFCLKQTIKCWQLQLPAEAAQYYLDFLAMNGIVMAFSPLTDYVWYIYWLIVIFIGWIGAKYLWDYITPKYQVSEQGEDDDKKGKKQKKQKKQKVKYIKH